MKIMGGGVLSLDRSQSDASKSLGYLLRLLTPSSKIPSTTLCKYYIIGVNNIIVHMAHTTSLFLLLRTKQKDHESRSLQNLNFFPFHLIPLPLANFCFGLLTNCLLCTCNQDEGEGLGLLLNTDT